MEALYRKLYDKYTKLKNENESQFDKLNHDQEVKFLNYEAAADQMIEYYKSENDRLIEQVDSLKSELASIRSSNEEKHNHIQKLLMDRNQKITDLSEEVARLQKLELDQFSFCTIPEETGRVQEASNNDTSSDRANHNTDGNLMKKRKLASEVRPTLSVITKFDHTAAQHVHVDRGDSRPTVQDLPKPLCCGEKTIISLDGDATDTSSVNCLYQNLVKLVIGMKVSTVTQSSGDLSVLVSHQTSGYSFRLSWVKNSRGDVELMYNVLSLGTVERVAHEWMKETIVLSTSMCGLFFEKISCVINRC